MKKAIVLLLALVAVGALVYAANAPAPTYLLTGDAGVKWQYDLDASKHGFTNFYDLSFKYMLMDGVTATTKGGEGDTTYGQIDIKELNLMVAEVTDKSLDTPVWKLDDYDGNNISISAKIVSGALTVTIYGAPSGNYENAVYVPLFSKDAGYTYSSAMQPKIAPGGGLKVGYSLGDMGSFSVGIGSATAGAVNTDQYAFGADVTLTPAGKMLTIVGGLWYGKAMNKDDHGTQTYAGGDVVATGKVTVVVDTLTAYAAIDAANGTKLDYDLSGGVAYTLNEAKDSLNLDGYYSTVSGLGAIPAYAQHKGDVGLKFVDSEGFVPGVAFTVGFFADDLAASPANNPQLMSVAASGSYKVTLSDTTYAKPYAAVRNDLSSGKNLYAQVGLEAKLFPNTVLDANFTKDGTANDLNHVFAKDVNNLITVSAKITL